MNLREQYRELEDKVYNRFTELINIGDYSFVEINIRAIYDEVIKCINEEGIKYAEQEYNILESFEQIFYNDRRGNERMCYLLGVEKENGLYVFDEERFETIFISFSDLNGLHSKITVIEEIENS